MSAHLLDVIFRAAVWRAMHFAPLLLAIGIALVAAALLLTRQR